MKVKLPYLFICILSLFAVTTVKAQQYQHLTVSAGYNADIVANGPGSATLSTTAAADDANYSFMSTDFQPTAAPGPAYALPANGLVTSAVTTGLTYQMAPFSGNNSLRIPTTNTSGTLTISNAVQASKLFLLATTGSGSATITTTITFTDNTTQSVSGTLVPDWFFSTAQPVALSGFGRVNRLTNAMENPAGDPRLYQMMIVIAAANQAKVIQSIQVTKTSTAAGILNLMAISAEVSPTCLPPSTLTATSGATSGTVTWIAPPTAPSGGFDYYFSTSATAPIATTPPTNTLPATQTSITFNSLPTGVQHYFWIRSNCGTGDLGGWQPATFTTGQMSFTYTSGDIPTLYNTNPTTTSTTTCPATLSINVPLGYQIASANVTYNMTAAGGTFMDEQMSIIRCVTNNQLEASVAAGVGGSAGTYTFTRALTIANGLAGTVEFEMRAFRVWGGSGCTTNNSKVDNNTWKITIVYAPIPCTPLANPTVTDQSACPATTIGGLVASGVPGAFINWYTDPSGGTPLASATAVVTDTYYVSQATSATCESSRVPVEVTVSNILPPTTTAQTLCAGNTVANLQATGDTGATFKWYTASTGGAPLAPATELTAGPYFVSQTVAGCESLRTESLITLTVTPAPTAQPQAVCSGSTIADLEITGTTGTIKWYAGPTGGDELSTSLFVSAGSYYVTQTIAGCESARTTIAVTINTTPVPGVASQLVCPGATIADLEATAATGATLHWYQGMAEVEEDHVIGEGPYYVSQILNNCESSKVQVTINIYTVPVPETSEEQLFCTPSTIADLFAEAVPGGTINWYETMDDETPLDEEAVISTGSYFVSQSHEGCESARTEVVVTIGSLPAPESENQTFCPGHFAGELEATGVEGATFNWYETNDTEEEPLTEDTELTAGSYFVSQVLNGCESERAEISVSISITPVPATETNNPMCAGSTIEDLFIISEEGAIVNWYLTEDGTEPLAEGTELEAGTYYASQTINGCESERNDTNVTINALPGSPSGSENQEFTTGETVADLIIGVAVGAEVNWYIMNEEEVLVSISNETELVDGMTYYVSQTIEGCESTTRGITVEEILGTVKFDKGVFSVHPNPAETNITISANENIAEINIYTLLGQKVLSQKTNGLTAEINISALAKGNYILQAILLNGKISTAKMIKQ